MSSLQTEPDVTKTIQELWREMLRDVDDDDDDEDEGSDCNEYD